MKLKIQKFYNSKNINLFFFSKDNFNFIYLYNNINKQNIYIKIYSEFLQFINNDMIFVKMKMYFYLIINLARIYYSQLNTGFFIEIITKGIGYNVYTKKKFIFFDLGQSHYIGIKIPNYCVVKRFKARLAIFGFLKDKIQNFAKKLLSLQIVDAYKGKGVIYKNQKIVLKEGKKR